MGIRAVVAATGDPGHLAVAIGGADLRGGLGANLGVLVGEQGDGNVAVIGAVVSVGVAITHPGVGRDIYGAARDPREDVVGRFSKASKTTVTTGHTSHRLTRTTVGGVLVGDLNASVIHALVIGVQPDRTLVLGADTRIRSGVRSFEGNASVMTASPGAGCAINGDQCAVVGYIFNAVAIVTGGIPRVVGDDKVRTVHACLAGVNEITVEIRRHGQAVDRVNVRPTQPRLPGLLSIGVAVENGNRRIAGGSIGGTRRHRFIG